MTEMVNFVIAMWFMKNCKITEELLELIFGEAYLFNFHSVAFGQILNRQAVIQIPCIIFSKKSEIVYHLKNLEDITQDFKKFVYGARSQRIVNVKDVFF